MRLNLEAIQTTIDKFKSLGGMAEAHDKSAAPYETLADLHEQACAFGDYDALDLIEESIEDFNY